MTNINKYYQAIAKQKRLGADNEQNLRPVFYILLDSYLANEGLTKQYEQRECTGLYDNYPDARILREDIVVGHVENKDAKDNIYKEIDKKLNDRGYPQMNILFENTKRMVLYQDKKRVDDIDINDEEELDRVLLRFVWYQTKEQKEFLEAKYILKSLVPDLAEELREYFAEEEHQNTAFKTKLDEFLQLCQQLINKNLVKNDVFEIVIQHILTEDIFIIFFGDGEFHKSNTISRTVYELIQTFGGKIRDIKNKIDPYLIVMKKYIHRMGKDDKKDILKIFYEDFYTALNNKKADIQGIVYTPLPIVKFMLESTDHLLYKYFNKSIASNHVKILDPCTGTGVFMSELIEKLPEKDLQYKYENELFVNEIDILPYYIANLNIEYSYLEKMNTYKEFQNICLIDTLEFEMSHKDGQAQLFSIANMNSENLERAIHQYNQEISVVIGNPPYNANQQSENHNNKNKTYSIVDARIKDTYIKHSTAQKTKQFDMYKRFIRWASDRIKANGMISFITNNAYLDARGDDGFRKCVQTEFDYIYIVDLKGNARKNDKKEGQSVFNIMVGTSIIFLIKDERIKDKKAKIFYYSMPDGASRQSKLHALTTKFEHIEFDQIFPTDKGQWLGQTDNDFEEHPALISKVVKNKGIGDEKAIFQLFSNGVLTARDQWAYDKNPKQLAKKVQKLIAVYDKERLIHKGKRLDDFQMKQDLDYSIKWSEHVKLQMIADKNIEFDKSKIRSCLYRPFCQSNLYFDSSYIDRRLQNPKLFPTGAKDENLCIAFNPLPNPLINVLALNTLADIKCNMGGGNGGSHIVSLYRYDENGQKISNITDWGLKLFTDRYPILAEVSPEERPEQIMEYCYAMLSSPIYQLKYADNLKVDYPRIPLHDDFAFYQSRGRELIKLHAHYEDVHPYADLKITTDENYLPEGIDNPNKNHVTHPMKIDKKLGILHLDAKNKIENIPLEVFNYKIGSRSALDWIVEYHKFKKLNPQKELHHKTLIDEGLDTYDWKSIRANLLTLIPKIVTVSLDTIKIYDELREQEGK